MGMEMSSIEEMLKEGATLTLEPEPAPELPVEEAKPIPKVYEEEQYLTDDECYFTVWLRYTEKNVSIFRRNA